MYMDLMEEDPNKNRKRGLIIFVICVILLGTIVKCAGQPCVNRTRPFFNSDSTRYVACLALNFGVTNTDETEDVIQMGILADSLPNNEYSPVIFVWFPKSSNTIYTAEIDFGFKKDGIETLKFTFINRNVGYAEYRLTRNQFILFRDHLYEYVNFRINHNDLIYTEDWVEDSFISDFLKLL